MNEKNSFKGLLIGLVMLVAGAFWFLSSVRVVTGFYRIHLGGFSMNGGLVVIPFIVGIIWLFINHKSIWPKILTTGGLVIIFASVIAGTQFIFSNTSLYSYLIMLVFIFGGAALVLQYVFRKSNKK